MGRRPPTVNAKASPRPGGPGNRWTRGSTARTGDGFEDRISDTAYTTSMGWPDPFEEPSDIAGGRGMIRLSARASVDVEGSDTGEYRGRDRRKRVLESPVGSEAPR